MKIIFSTKVLIELANIFDDEIEPGPATNGIANGVKANPSFNKASFSSISVDLILETFDSKFVNPFLKNMIPPAILNASIVTS